MRDISIGAALAIVALLVFTVVWPYVMDLMADGTEVKFGELDSTTSFIILALIFGPPIWAIWLITEIVRGPS